MEQTRDHSPRIGFLKLTRVFEANRIGFLKPTRVFEADTDKSKNRSPEDSFQWNKPAIIHPG